jgi:hypothetical protein
VDRGQCLAGPQAGLFLGCHSDGALYSVEDSYCKLHFGSVDDSVTTVSEESFSRWSITAIYGSLQSKRAPITQLSITASSVHLQRTFKLAEDGHMVEVQRTTRKPADARVVNDLCARLLLI